HVLRAEAAEVAEHFVELGCVRFRVAQLRLVLRSLIVADQERVPLGRCKTRQRDARGRGDDPDRDPELHRFSMVIFSSSQPSGATILPSSNELRTVSTDKLSSQKIP